MKVTKIEGRKVKVIRGKLVDTQLKAIYIMGEITSVVKASKELAKANGLKSADGVTVDISTREVNAIIDLESLFEGVVKE